MAELQQEENSFMNELNAGNEQSFGNFLINPFEQEPTLSRFCSTAQPTGKKLNQGESLLLPETLFRGRAKIDNDSLFSFADHV